MAGVMAVAVTAAFERLGRFVESVDGQGLAVGLRQLEAGDWQAALEWGKEAEDSPMAGAAAYGGGDTVVEALHEALNDTRVPPSEDQGFSFVVEVARLALERHYPDGLLDRTPDDPGARLAGALRDVLRAELPVAEEPGRAGVLLYAAFRGSLAGYTAGDRPVAWGELDPAVRDAWNLAAIVEHANHLARDDVRDYLDGAVRKWRRALAAAKDPGPGDGDAAARDVLVASCYIDAFQSVRSSLLGQTLADPGRSPFERHPVTEGVPTDEAADAEANARAEAPGYRSVSDRIVPGRYYVCRKDPPVALVDQPPDGFKMAVDARKWISGRVHDSEREYAVVPGERIAGPDAEPAELPDVGAGTADLVDHFDRETDLPRDALVMAVPAAIDAVYDARNHGKDMHRAGAEAAVAVLTAVPARHEGLTAEQWAARARRAEHTIREHRGSIRRLQADIDHADEAFDTALAAGGVSTLAAAGVAYALGRRGGRR